jgi:thiamine-phosphate pyrophosphorylase
VKLAVPATGLYAITDSTRLADTHMEDAVAQAIRGGARIIQYREKHLHGQALDDTAGKLADLCRRCGVPLIINDDIGLAMRSNAAGVHLGKTDPPLAQARAQLGPDAIIGVSCYNSLERALDAAAAGADYVAFGRFFPSGSKPKASHAEPGVLTRARDALTIPLVAIGGITPDNGSQLLTAGADLLAAIDGVFGQADIEAAARRYADLFNVHTR